MHSLQIAIPHLLDINKAIITPQPVYETKKAIEHPSFDVLEVLVDTKTALENIKRLLDSRKDIQYTVEEREDYKVTLSKLKG